MAQERESFVVWVERVDARDGRLRGDVECLRRSERTSFDSADGLLRFIERCAAAPDRSRSTPSNDPGEP